MIRPSRLIACAIAVTALLCGGPALAETGEKAAPAARNTVSVTTGWRPIRGWERSVIRRDPNLAHWSWIPMNEMEKSYRRLPAGYYNRKGAQATTRHYVYPNKIASAPPGSVHPKPRPPEQPFSPKYIKPNHVPVASRDGGGKYIKPNHIATVIRARSDTYIYLYTPKTSLKLAAPQVGARLAAPSTRIQLAARSTDAQIKVPKRLGPAPAVDEMVGDRGAADADSFSEPDPYKHNVYGLARHVDSGCARAKTRLSAHLIGRKKRTRKLR